MGVFAKCTPLKAVAFWVPNVLLRPISLGIFCFLGRDTGLYRNPLCQNPLFLVPDLRWWNWWESGQGPKFCGDNLWWKNLQTLGQTKNTKGMHRLRGPAATLFISHDACSDRVGGDLWAAKLFFLEFIVPNVSSQKKNPKWWPLSYLCWPLSYLLVRKRTVLQK